MESTNAYMLIFRDTSPESYESMSREETKQCLQTWNAWVGSIAAEGKLQHGHPLEPVVRIVANKRGETIVDGPFAEAKEAVGGYLLLSVGSMEEALEIAQRCPNLQYGMEVEVREVATGCHLAKTLGLPSMEVPANV